MFVELFATPLRAILLIAIVSMVVYEFVLRTLVLKAWWWLKDKWERIVIALKRKK